MKKNMIGIGLALSLFAGAMLPVTTFADNQSSNVSQPTAIDNQKLKLDLSRKLSNAYPDSNIEVTVFNNQVLLTGQVSKASIKKSAFKLVSKSEGVHSVSNHLSVGTKESTKQTLKDSAITTKAIGELATISGVKSTEVKIVTTSGVIYLLGSGNLSQQTKNEINATFKGIDGAKDVVFLFD